MFLYMWLFGGCLKFEYFVWFWKIRKHPSNIHHLRSLYPSQMSIQLQMSWVKSYSIWWTQLLKDDPVHVFIESILVICLLYFLLLSKSSKVASFDEKLSKKEQENLIQEWKCAPMTPPLTETEKDVILNARIVQRFDGPYVELVDESSGKITKVLNFAGFDFLGLANSEDLKAVSRDALNLYGCGSCGPRGFYGTIDAHLTLEDTFSELCGSESAIMYSDGASAVSSTVSAFAKRGDLLVVDEGVYEG